MKKEDIQSLFDAIDIFDTKTFASQLANCITKGSFELSDFVYEA